VRIVAGGDALLAPSVTRRLIEDFARSAPPRRIESSLLSSLTEREVEVLTLVGRGMSNTEIAAQLFIAEQTVKTHVSKLFSKLGLRDRVQAVVFAYDVALVLPGGGT
jgi:DNA-binding NarL/FixJ family response regulator